MFENILHQNLVIDSLVSEIKSETLPQSLLFFGPNYSGKLTTALELARVLCCEKEGLWSCNCINCKQHLTMQNPYLIITGQRYFINEISHSIEYFKENRTDKSRYIFIRNVRKLIKRFSEDIWNIDDAKYKKCIPSINRVEEALYILDPSQEIPQNKELNKILDSILKDCQKLEGELPKGNIPINQIRNITNWVRRSTSGSKKIVILERAELMQESSRNSLLKILEEPPKNTYFILISEGKNKILPTILSRVRAYGFKERSQQEQKNILTVLYNRNDFNLISSFFNSYGATDQEDILSDVKLYYNTLLDFDSSYIDVIKLKIDSDIFKAFLEKFTDILQGHLNENCKNLTLSQIEMINTHIRDKIIKQSFFNQNPNLLLETLFYQIKRIIHA